MGEADHVPLTIEYTNWRGETSIRRIIPSRVYFGHNEWHPKPQWLIEARDLDKGAMRVFAMVDMRPIKEGA